MDFNRQSASGYNAGHPSSNFNQHLNVNSANPQQVNNATGVPPTMAMAGQNQAVAGAGMQQYNAYNQAQNNTAGIANNWAAAGRSIQSVQYGQQHQQQQQSQQSVPNLAGQNHQPQHQQAAAFASTPSSRQQQIYNAAAPVGGRGSTNVNSVPNPLGMGGGGGVTAPAAPSGPSKTDLLKAMYQSRQRQQVQQVQQQQPQQPAAPQQQVQQQAVQGMQANYRAAAGLSQHQTQGIPQGHAANSTYGTVQTNMQQNQAQNTYRQGIQTQQPQQAAVQQVQTNYQQQQRSTSQPQQLSTHQMQLQQQQYQQQNSQQVNQQTNQQAYQQQQSQHQLQQAQQAQQLQQQQGMARTSQQSQSSSHQGASTHTSSSSSSQQKGGASSSSSGKSRFHLTPTAKVTLREAVLSAIRHPNGEVDPGCLQRAMAQGLPKQAILNAAVVARKRDQNNREQRRLQQQQQQGGAQQQPSQQGTQQQSRLSPSVQQQSRQTQPQMVHTPSRNNTASSSSYPASSSDNSAKAQMQQLYNQSNTGSVAATQYNQSAQYSQQSAAQQQQQQQQILYQQQQAQQRAQQQAQQQAAQQRQQQLQQQQTAYQRQLQAQQMQQRKLQEEARKKQLELKYKQEQQRRAAEQARRQQEQQRRLLEEQKRKAAEEAQRKRQAAVIARMKPWGRTQFALVVKQTAKGLPMPQPQTAQQAALLAKAVMRQSTWGGTSMCQDRESALVSALKRTKDGESDSSKALNENPDNIRAAADMIRKQLRIKAPSMLKNEAEPPSREQLRQKRTKAITLKLLPQTSLDQLKRHKLQPKRETKFLDKHIRRARQMTADAHSKRHKELLKGIVGHQSEFYKFHRIKKNESAKLARVIRDQFKKAEAVKEKEVGQAEKARLAALRANDMAAYTSLLEDTKNERLKFLLDKTDECMNQISTLLSSRAAEEEEDIKRMGGEGTVKSTFSENATGGSYYETAHVKSESVRQPNILVGGDLKEYQMGGLQWLVSLYNNRLNGILADEMGLGKTIQTIALLAYLIETKQNLGPYLVIVPLSTLSNWVNEFAKWLPAANCICYKGTPQQRKQLFRDEVADGHFNVLLTTYEFVIRDKGSLKKLAWQYAIVDEGHRMKNNQSKFAVTLGTQYNTRRRVLLTGTPMQNNLPELWALLNFLLPEVFNSADTFDQWFNKPFASFGKSASENKEEESSDELLSNEERMLIIHRLHELLRPFMLRRVKSEVLDQLPEKVEKVIRCELSSWQKELYKQISHKIADEAATKNFNRGLNNVVMQLRKVCNHPYLFSQDGYHMNEDIIRTSGKMELLDRMLPKMKAAGHRVLMFTQMTKMMPILEDYFAYRGFSSLRLDGSTTADDREKRMYMFNAPDSPYFIFLLSTRAGGLGLNLATADTVIIFDSDWNPMMDLQAQDRAHRIGQRKDVRVFRIITQSPVEEKILSRATEKLQMNELVVEAGKFDKSGQGKEDNSLERLKMMELLLTDFDQNQSAQGAATSEEDFEKETDDGEVEGEDSKNIFNEMISVNDDDYKLYCKIDMQRTDAPALYDNISDCPDWILYPNGKPEEGAELVDETQPEFLGKRRAAAGEKQYDDGLTEKQFCRMMDKQSVDEEKGKEKRKKKRSRNAVDPSLILEHEGGARKRAKASHFEAESSTSARSKAAASAGSIIGNGEMTAAIHDRIVSITKSMVYFKDKASKRKLSDIFLEKPCPQTYADYYRIVDKPIGMNDILRKGRAKLYSSINDFRDDWNLLFKNASTYNGEGSWIVADGKVLKAELEKLMEKNGLTVSAQQASKKPVRIKLSLKMGKKKKAPKAGDSNRNGAPPDASMKSTDSQSEVKSVESGEDYDSNTEGNSGIVGMDEREASSKRGKNRHGGAGSRGGTSRLVRRT